MANIRFPGGAAWPRKTPLVLALLLAAATLLPQAALAASGGAMGGSSSSSSSSKSTGSSSSESHHRHSYHYYPSRTYVSVGTPATPSVATGDAPGAVFWLVALGFVLLVAAAIYRNRPRTTVVKLQVRSRFCSIQQQFIHSSRRRS